MANKIMKIVTQDHYGPEGIDYRVGERFPESQALPESVLFTYAVVPDPEPVPQSYPIDSPGYSTGEPPKQAAPKAAPKSGGAKS